MAAAQVDPLPWVTRPFVPAVGLGGHHIQTIWSTVLQRAPSPPWTRVEVETRDGDVCGLDVLDSNAETARVGSPWLLVLHGLEGSSDSGYARRMVAAAAERGWRAAILNLRGCGGLEPRLTTTYHLARPDDLLAAIGWVDEHLTDEPSTPLVLAGYSLGASQVINLLCRDEPLPDRLVAAAAVSTPFLPVLCIPRLNTGLGHTIYGASFLRRLRRKVRARRAIYEGVLDIDAVLSAPRLVVFEDRMTAPLNGFDGVDDYCEQAASSPHLPQARRPLLCLNAEDDHIIPSPSLPVHDDLDGSPVWLVRTRKGGHVGFVRRGDRGWLERTLLDGVQWMIDHPQEAGSPPQPSDGRAHRLDP